MYKGVFVSYRRGKHTQRNKQILIRIEGVNSRSEAARFIGRKSAWESKTGKKDTWQSRGHTWEKGFSQSLPKEGTAGTGLRLSDHDKMTFNVVTKFYDLFAG